MQENTSGELFSAFDANRVVRTEMYAFSSRRAATQLPCLRVQSQPLYLETFQEGPEASSDALTFHYLVHASLDGVEEKSERSFTWLGLCAA